MATSLAEQLQRLAVPQTSLLKNEKKKASLLFDPKEAAGIRKEVFHQIGLEGFEELCSKNPVFESFRNNLFSPLSKNFDRVIEDKHANEKLNKTINKLLLLLSPYFSLACTHKVLEFLVDRFMIHQFNRDSLILLSLPYHESNIFVRVIQICEFRRQNEPLYFLKSIQKPGVHMTKQTLLVHAATHPAFLKLVSNLTIKLARVHENPNLLTVAFNFFNIVFCGTVEYSSEVNDDQITQMVPALLAGLKSSIPDFTASCYIIIARLSAKTILTDKLLNRFVELVSEVRCQSLKIEAVLALVILYQSQTQYRDMPKQAVINLCNLEWMSKSLSLLSEGGSNIDSFLKVLIQKTVELSVNNDLKKQQDFLKNLLNELKLDDNFIPAAFRLFLDALNPDMSSYSLDVKSWLKDILSIIETQYPTQFDVEVKIILNGKFSEVNHKRKVCLQQILKHTLKTKGTSNVFEKLYHPSEEIRKEGIKHVYKIHQNLNENERDLVTSALINKLNDDNAKVVLEALKTLKKIKCSYDKFFDDLVRLIRKGVHTGNDQWTDVVNIALEMLCSKTEFSWEVFLEVLPFLLPRSLGELARTKNILQQPLFAQNKHLNMLHHNLNHLKVNQRNVDSFAERVVENLPTKSETLIEELIVLGNSDTELFTKNPINQYCVILILSKALRNPKDLKYINATLEICYKFYSESEKNSFEPKPSVKGYLEVAKSGKFPVLGTLECVLNVVEDPRAINVDFSQTKLESRFFELCLLIFFKDVDHCKSKTAEFLKILVQLHRKIDFLLNASNYDFDSAYILKFLKYLLDDILEHKDFPNMKISLEDKTFPYIICLLLNTEKSVRQIAMKILKYFKNNSLNSNPEWLKFIQDLINHKKDLIMDECQTPLIVSKLLQNDENGEVLTALVTLVSGKICPIYVRSRLLYLIVHVNDFNLLNSLSVVVPDMLRQNNKGFSALACDTLIGNIVDAVAQASTKKTHLYKFMQQCLNGHHTEIVLHDEVTNLRKIILTHYSNKNVLSTLPELLNTLIDDFCKIYVHPNDPDCVALVTKIFKHMDLDAAHIVHLLEAMRDVQTLRDNSEKKIRQQRKAMPTVAILDALEWKKGIAILELIQNKKKIKNSETLVPILFDVLKKCLDFDEQSAVEYPKQLILATVLLIGRKVENIPEKVFDVESIVQCVRSSQNPQTHHHAMLVLAYVAKLVPDKVLQHIMAIFTFVGSSLLRHDDAYSTQVISQILDTTVPIFLEDDHRDKLVKVLSVFVDACLDVPEHRRVSLYKQLLNNIDPNDNLYLFLILVFDSFVMNCAKQKSAKGSENNNRLNIARNLCQEFTPEITLNSCIKIIEFIKVMPIETDDVKSFQHKELLSFDSYTAKQLRHYKYTATTFVASLLSAEHFVNQIARLNDADLYNLEKIFKDLIISVLTCIQKTAKISDNNRNSPQTQYWKVILHHSYDILDAVNALLPANMFLLVTKGLLVHNLLTVKRRALDLLNSKLHNNINVFDSCEKNEVYGLIPQVLSIIELTQKETLDSDQEILVQTALLSLKLFVKGFAQKDPEKFVEILKFVTNLLNLNLTSSNIVASVILCLAELCVDLRAHAIACLSDFMSSFLKVLKNQKHQETSNLLLLSVVTTLHKLLDSLPLFLSPYLGKILFEVSILISKFHAETKDQKMLPLINKLTNLKYKIGSNIPVRVLIPAISTSYDNLVKKKAFKGINPLMDILIEAIRSSNQSDITTNLPDLTTFFLKALEFRTENLTSMELTNEVEKSLIKGLTSLVLKLSENIFRPFFYKLYDWAVRSTKQKSERIITFYNIAQEIANSLKGLFVLFAGEFLKHAIQILDSLNKGKNEETYFGDENKDLVLLEYVLMTLNAVFEYDNQKFLNKDRFDLMMQPLVDQLENHLGGLNSLSERNVKLLTPAILHFTLATGEDSLWKQMNYQILLKMRSAVPEIRLATLHCLTEVVVKLGEDFLPLLPETIPFLAELLEDEDEKVEQSCRKAVQEMEKVLGEPLQKYF